MKREDKRTPLQRAMIAKAKEDPDYLIEVVQRLVNKMLGVEVHKEAYRLGLPGADAAPSLRPIYTEDDAA